MKKVLIIDDDLAFQKTMTEMLKTRSFEVISAYDGEEGLAKANLSPDLILLDVRMPKLDGLTMLRELQEGKDEKNPVPVLITSNSSSLEHIGEGVELGIKGYIVKSDETLETIANKVGSILNSPKI